MKAVLYNLKEHLTIVEYEIPKLIPVIRMPKPQPVNFGVVMGGIPDCNPIVYSEYRLVGALPDGRYFYVLDDR